MTLKQQWNILHNIVIMEIIFVLPFICRFTLCVLRIIHILVSLHHPSVVAIEAYFNKFWALVLCLYFLPFIIFSVYNIIEKGTILILKVGRLQRRWHQVMISNLHFHLSSLRQLYRALILWCDLVIYPIVQFCFKSPVLYRVLNGFAANLIKNKMQMAPGAEMLTSYFYLMDEVGIVLTWFFQVWIHMSSLYTRSRDFIW